MPARKGQGQWALGYREPLNPNERSKRDNDGLNVRQRIIDIYQHTGFAGIDPGDLRGRFRWYGLYTQRAPGIPGGRTAILEPEELEDEYFMMRIRIDGGALTSEQLRGDRRDLDDVRPRRRRHHRPAERPAALDPDRGRPDDLGEARGGRAVDHRGLRRHTARHARLPARGRGRRLGARRRVRRCATTVEHVHRRPGVLQPAAQVQDLDLRLCAALHQPRDQRRRRSSASSGRTARPASTSGSAAGCRPTRCSPSGSACSSSRTRSREVWAGVDVGLSRLRLPPLPQPRPVEVPASPTGVSRSSAKCWRRSTSAARSRTAPRPSASPAHRDHVGIERAE